MVVGGQHGKGRAAEVLGENWEAGVNDVIDTQEIRRDSQAM